MVSTPYNKRPTSSSSSTPGNTTPLLPSGQNSTAASPRITPLHDPNREAKVLPQHKVLGNANANPIVPGRDTDPSISAGLGQKALLAKKFAKSSKPTVSPTDQMQSPVTQKLSQSKQRHFGKGKPAQLSQSFVAIRNVSSASTASAYADKENQA